MSRKVIGYIVVCAEKKTGLNGGTFPLAYGESDHPEPSMLLRDRGVTLFQTKDGAWDALKDTLTRAQDQGCTWPKTFVYTTVEVYETEAA